MSMFSGGSAIAMAAVAGAVVVGGAWWFENGRATLPEDTSATTVALVPETQAKPSTDQPAVAQPAEESDAQDEAVAETPISPKPEAANAVRAVAFDEVRREEDGMTIIAGRAQPGAAIDVLLDGASITQVTADGQGKFAAITMIAPDGLGHVLSLVQTVGEEQFASLDQIILAPLAAPVAVAEAAPETQETVPSPETKNEDAATEVAEATRDATAVDTGSNVEDSSNAATSEIALQSGTDVQADASKPTTTVTTEEQVGSTEQASTGSASGQEAVPVETAEAASAAGPESPIDESEEANQVAEADVSPSNPTIAAAPQAPATPEAASTANAAPKATPAPAASSAAPKVAVLKATEEGVELLNVPRPEAMENVALDTISYSDAGDVQLAGRAQTETRNVRVYLNNTSIVSLAVDDQGRWRGDLPDVDEGIYTLRVDEVAEDGSVTSRVETPFKREAPETLAEAAAAAEGPLKQITVQKGATLWAIAQDRYGDGLLYVNVFQANSGAIRDPNLIYPGQVFELPD